MPDGKSAFAIIDRKFAAAGIFAPEEKKIASLRLSAPVER